MFIKFTHHDIRCIIASLEDIEPIERTEQEVKTLEKAKLILEAQKLAATRIQPTLVHQES